MRITADWIGDEAAQAVMAALAAGGKQALFVGGCVRNALLGVPVADIDIATEARPETVVELARAAGLKPVPTGIEHGTVTVVSHGRGFEVTTFRMDLETDGRRAVVAFADDVADDASRRDFTMNALYVDADGQVIDPLGGLPDVLARRVRFVGDPHARIAEDYLRILRFFRFHALYGDPAQGLDSEALAACAAHVDGLARLSRERIGHEMRRLLKAPDPAPSVAAMAAAGVLAHVVPGADPRALAPLVHLEGQMPPRWLRRLAALGGDASDLRLSRDETRGLEARQAALASGDGPAVMAFRHGAPAAEDAILIRAASLAALPPEGWQAEVARGAGASFPIRAADLPGLSGATLGERLRVLQEAWIASDLRADKATLLA
jgi:poly(A) polymerase